MDVTDVTGKFGKLQWQIFFMVTLRPICWSVIKMNYIFIVQKPTFVCDETSGEMSGWNNSDDQCFLAAFNSSSLPCTHWNYNTYNDKRDIVEEWDLVCSNVWMISFGHMVYSIANFIFYMPAGHCADKFGRRPLTLIGQSLVLLVSIAIPLSSSMWMYLALRFALGAFVGLAQNPFMCIYLEAVGAEYRDSLMVGFSATWGLGTILCSGIAWLVDDWRTLSWICSIPFQLPLLLGIWWFVPESSRWLLTVRKYDLAEKQLIKQAKTNGMTIMNPRSVMSELTTKIEEDSRADKASFMDVVMNRHLRNTAIVLYLTFVFTVFISHGFKITIGTLGGSVYINMMLSGLSEAGCLVLYFLLVRRMNRRYGLCLLYVLAGVLFLSVALIPTDIEWLKITIAMTGALVNSLAYTIIYIFAAELFPTNVRAVAVSGAMTAGRIGSILAPTADVMSVYYGKLLPVILYGCLSLLTSGIFFLLPETRNRNLPDTVLQSERLNDKKAASQPS